jgi:hypothetical protein
LICDIASNSEALLWDSFTIVGDITAGMIWQRGLMQGQRHLAGILTSRAATPGKCLTSKNFDVTHCQTYSADTIALPRHPQA